jgi:3-hydroxybutyryl-CoA dehydrogenase
VLYEVIDTGNSRSFPGPHAFLEKAEREGDVVVIIGEHVGRALQSLASADGKTAVLIELGTECLGLHTGEDRGSEGSNVLGFARFRLGSADPATLVAVCGDFDGRILDRLVRPYFNAALRRLDEGLATADDLDTTLKLGLGYPEGPISLLERTGLEHHYDVTKALFDALGDPAYAPARRARLAKMRSTSKL